MQASESIFQRVSERPRLQATWNCLQQASSYKGRMAPPGLISSSSPHLGLPFPPQIASVGIPLRLWQWALPLLAIAQHTQVTKKTSPQEETPSSLLGSCKTRFPPMGIWFWVLQKKKKPHETKHFSELNWTTYFIEKELKNIETPWLVQLDKRITFEVWNVK